MKGAFEKAKASGEIDKIAKEFSISYLLASLAIEHFECGEDILKNCGLKILQLSHYAHGLEYNFDMFYKEFKSMMNRQNFDEFSKDYEYISRVINEFIGKE